MSVSVSLGALAVSLGKKRDVAAENIDNDQLGRVLCTGLAEEQCLRFCLAVMSMLSTKLCWLLLIISVSVDVNLDKHTDLHSLGAAT